MTTAGKEATAQDFYVEYGRVVFTEAYLLRRGQCCGNGCRHCPYRADRFSGKGLAADAHGYARELQK